MAKRVLRHKTTLVGKSLESIRSSNYAKSDSCYDIFATVRGQAILTAVSTLIALLYNWLLPQLTPNFLWAQPPLTDFLLSPQLNWLWSLNPAAQPSDWTGSFESGWRMSGYSLSCHTFITFSFPESFFSSDHAFIHEALVLWHMKLWFLYHFFSASSIYCWNVAVLRLLALDIFHSHNVCSL